MIKCNKKFNIISKVLFNFNLYNSFLTKSVETKTIAKINAEKKAV